MKEQEMAEGPLCIDFTSPIYIKKEITTAVWRHL